MPTLPPRPQCGPASPRGRDGGAAIQACSGWASPTYTDCRRLISFPRARNQLLAMAMEQLARDAGVEIVE